MYTCTALQENGRSSGAQIGRRHYQDDKRERQPNVEPENGRSQVPLQRGREIVGGMEGAVRPQFHLLLGKVQQRHHRGSIHHVQRAKEHAGE